MAMLERSQNMKIVSKTIGIGFVTSIIIFFLLLVVKAGTLSEVTSATQTIVAFGPLKLMEISKQPLAGGGFQATMQLLSGMLGYFAIWLVGSLSIALMRLRSQRVKLSV